MDVFTPAKTNKPIAATHFDELLTSAETEAGNEAVSLRNRGFRAAGQSDASAESVRVNLTMLHQEHVARLGTREGEYRARIDELMQANEPLQRQATHIETDEIQGRQQQIQRLKDEIEDIPSNPRKYELENDEFSPFEFAVSSIFLVFLTLYLIVFYISTGYSAFFRTASQDIAAIQRSGDTSVLFNSILDPLAFQHARQQGGFALTFVLLTPFVFLVIGYLIHKAIERKNQLLTSALTAFAFGFDVLIAGKIVYNLYDLKVKTGVVEATWHTSQLLTDIDFWIVLAAGFLVYLLWGLLLHTVAQQAKHAQPIQAAIRRRKRQIEDLTTQIQEWRTKLEELRAQLNTNTTQMKKLQASLKHRTIMWSEFEGEIAQFTKGWLEFISGTQVRVQERQEEATNLVKAYLQQVESTLKPSALAD